MNRKYMCLDGIRGVAALAVVLWHSQSLGLPHLASSYLAVDMFFLMSGFVIGHAYEGRLKSGMPFRRFIYIRFVRLYPLYILGSLGVLAYFLVFKILSPNEIRPFATLLVELVFAVLCLPVFQPQPEMYLFPLNPPGWSLFLEICVNFAYVICLPWLSNNVLKILAVVFAVGLCVTAFVFPTMDVGWNWATILGGVPRVGFAFTVGILLFRYQDRIGLPVSVPSVFVVLAFILMMAVPMDGVWGKICALLVILGGFPILAVAAIQSEPSSVLLRKVLAVSGAISYPVYALHHPLISWGYSSFAFIGKRPMEIWWIGPLIFIVVIAVSWLALVLFDEPVRRLLKPKEPSA